VLAFLQNWHIWLIQYYISLISFQGKKVLRADYVASYATEVQNDNQFSESD